MNTTDTNRLIATFMGSKYKNEPFFDEIKEEMVDYWYWTEPENGYPIGKLNNQRYSTAYMIENWAYHKSWDWLMPVVDKIETLFDGSINVKMDCIDCVISTGSQYAMAFPEKDFHIESREDNRFKALYNGIVKFIDAYNERKEKIKEKV